MNPNVTKSADTIINLLVYGDRVTSNQVLTTVNKQIDDAAWQKYGANMHQEIISRATDGDVSHAAAILKEEELISIEVFGSNYPIYMLTPKGAAFKLKGKSIASYLKKNKRNKWYLSIRYWITTGIAVGAALGTLWNANTSNRRHADSEALIKRLSDSEQKADKIQRTLDSLTSPRDTIK